MYVRTLLVMLATAAALAAQPPAPPPPDRFHARLRYEILAPRDEHVAQYDALVAHLKRLGFEFNPPLESRPETDREDPGKNYFDGLVASKQLQNLFGNLAVRTVFVDTRPLKEHLEGDDLDKPVRVRLELPSGFGLEAQKDFLAQVKLMLRELGFREATGYDNRGYTGRPWTRLVGAVPTRHLETLLKDLRRQPAGWFGPILDPNDLPIPLRSVTPIKVIEVLPDPDPIQDADDPMPRPAEYLEKISADLWALLPKAEDKKSVLATVQVLFAGQPEPDVMRRIIQDAVPGAFVEGQLGNSTTVHMDLGQLDKLASVPTVSVLRLPRPAHVDVDPTLTFPVDNAAVLTRSGLTALHQKGARGQGVRVVLLDHDFRGWDKLVAQRKLPANTQLVDLTAERNEDIQPAPYPPGEYFGHGTHMAYVVSLAAPAAQLLLVRILPNDPYRIAEVIQYVQRETISESLARRFGEVEAIEGYYASLRDILAKERTKVLNDFTDETDLAIEYGFWGPAFGWVFSDRSYHRLKVEHQEKLDALLRARDRRLSRLLSLVRELRGAHIVVQPFVWNDSFPLGGNSPLTRWLEDNNFKQRPIVFQSVGNTRGQAWNGLFQDADRNGLMEFVPSDTPLAPGKWNHELNFLAFAPYGGKQTLDLPEKARVRLTLQWREAHDPDYFLRLGDTDDWYRKPLAPLRISLLRQRDPEARQFPADSFDLVARTGLYPERIDHRPNGSVYEQVLEATLEKSGRYALRIERQPDFVYEIRKNADGTHATFHKIEQLTASGTRPLGAPTLAAFEKTWELKPSLFVQFVNVEQRLQGRLVLADYATDLGTLGLPADGRFVIAVGAADRERRPRSYAALGPPAFLELARTPTLFQYDDVGLGTGPAFGAPLASAFAAGLTASVLSSGVPQERLLERIRMQPGHLYHAP
jgi:hypothetical protein